MMARNPEIEKYFATMLQGIRTQGASMEAVEVASLEARKKATDYALANFQQLGDIASAGRIAGNSLLSAIGDIQTGLITLGRQTEGVDIGGQLNELNKTLEGGADTIGNSVNDLDEKIVTMKSILGDKMTPILDSYADEMNRFYNVTKSVADMLGEVDQGLKETRSQRNTQQLSQLTPAQREERRQNILMNKPMPGQPKPSWWESYMTMLGGSQTLAGEGAINLTKPGKGKAKGGISTGPLSGYQEILHGTEAVVPLPDNKTIPVTLDSSSLTHSLERNNSLLTDIARILKEGNNLSSHIARSVA
jgi:hypothetical protein